MKLGIQIIVLGLILFTNANYSYARMTLALAPNRLHEVLFADAIVQYNQKNYKNSIEILEKILEKNENQKSLELLALNYKELQQFDHAKKTYHLILKKMKEANLKPSETAPIIFEIGIIEIVKQNYEKALPYFLRCIDFQFNHDISQYFLGLIYYNLNDHNKSLTAFLKVLDGNNSKLLPATYLYIANLYNLKEDYESSLQYLLKAKNITEKSAGTSYIKLSNEYETQNNIIKNKILDSLNNMPYQNRILNFSALMGYDSNVLSVPKDVDSSPIANNKESYKTILKATYGQTTSPFKPSQKIWAYQFSGNLNTQKETQTGQFLTHDITYMLIKNPLSEISHAFRANANSSFQYQHSDEKNRGAFSPYSFGVQLNYIYSELFLKTWHSKIETGVVYENFLQDDVFFATMKKTNFDFFVQHILSQKQLKNIVNIFTGYDLHYSVAEGIQNTFYSVGVLVGNQLYLNTKNSMLLSFKYSLSDYFKQPGSKRRDNTVDSKIDYFYHLNQNSKLSGSISYLNNTSTIQNLYEFDRQQIIAGYHYSF